MALESDVLSEEDKDNGDVGNPDMHNGTGSIVVETAEDESEDEDVDFNPFLKGSLSEEASSSLSSEVEGLDAEVVNSHCEGLVQVSEGLSDHVGCMIDEFEDDRVGVSCEDEQENGMVRGMESVAISGTDVVDDVYDMSLDTRDPKIIPVVELDDEDAICMRTRARYSLASFTLDELETFLQETDDDDDLQNVDEEEEYRKFLAAVLKGGDGDDQGNVEGNDEEDDDEDNDADFEIEIQEALESDVDDCVITSHNIEELERSSRRPKTRQNRRRKSPASSKKNGVKREDRPLRPLVPIMYSAPDPSVPCLGANFTINPSQTQNLPPTGFFDHQIGQLYALMYEHVQLLIQVYSLCVLEPSRHHIAAQVKGLLSELLHKRDLVLAWRNIAYPTSCFPPQYVSSVSVQTQKCIPSPSAGSDGSDVQGCSWLPPIGGPVLSVLDVEPLKFVGKYIDDVSNAVEEHQKRCVEITNFYVEKQPLFHHPICPSPEVNCNVSRGDDPKLDACAVSSNDKVPKKTLAGALVESTKKQSVALVPQPIAKLALPFNPALFPHKPPLPSVANRVLFTDAEDVLLAMGIMEYNHDWKAIQRRFLPCKSDHQIFVRSKNRCSSKAPDNPIKTVRKFKTSPLTEDEKARIEQGLQAFKLDWISVWRAVVPYRDPSLLPRQWRIANGSQKSYKVAPGKKEKHRIYELNRRRSIDAAMDNFHTGSKEDNQTELAGGRNRCGDGVSNGNEAYVHEAFLADWRPFTAGPNPPNSRSCELQDVLNNHVNNESQSKRDCAQVVSVGSENLHHMNHKSFQAYMGSLHPSKLSTSKALGCESLLLSRRGRKPGISNFVKLAPELPPVKLPPAVRVISQASLRSSQLLSFSEVDAPRHGLENPGPDHRAFDCGMNLEKSVQNKTRVLYSNSESVSSQNCETLNNNGLQEVRGADLEPQMHPLLFRSPEEGHVASYPVKNSSIIPTFSFFPALQQKTIENLLRSPPVIGPATFSKSSISKEIASTSSSLDFHPFLQRTSDSNAKSFGADSTTSLLTTDLELSRDRYVEESIYRDGTDAAQLATSSKPTSPSANANDMDLGIQLSSSSRKRKISGHEGAGINPMVPSVNEISSQRNFAEVTKWRMNSHGQLSQNASHHLSDPLAAEDIRESGFDDSAAQLNKLSGGSSPCIKDNVVGQPLTEIVMEREELSDSNEEMEEDVEFECEEMTDSDGEDGSAAEQIVNTKYKDDGKISLARDINAEGSKSSTCDIPEGSRAQRKGRTSRADLAKLGKGSIEGSWLSLNSHGSHLSEQTGAKSTESSVGATPITSHSNRSSRKVKKSRKKSLGKQITELSTLDPLPSSSRKHRKQVIKAQLTSIAADIAVANDSFSEKDGKV